jgi:hypothetical protein
VLGASSREEVVRGVAESVLAIDGSGPLIITSACRVWHQKGLALNPSYRAAAAESYKTDARAADFVVSIRLSVRSWFKGGNQQLGCRCHDSRTNSNSSHPCSL